MQTNVLRSISQYSGEDDPKGWLLEIILLSCFTPYGKHLDDRWGFASLETGLGGEVSGAKIGVGQFLVAPGEIGGRSGPRL
jgi:hypothetical protein